MANTFGLPQVSTAKPLADSALVAPVKAPVPGLAGEKSIAKKINDQNIFLVGPAAGRIVEPGEQAGVTENVASIFALGQRTAKVAEVVASGKALDLSRLPRIQPIDFKLGQQPESIPLITRPDARRPLAASRSTDPVYLESRLKATARRLNLPDGTSLTLKFTRTNNGAIAMETFPAAANTKELALALQQDPRFVEALYASIGEGNRSNQVNFSFTAAAKGRLEGGAGARAKRQNCRRRKAQYSAPIIGLRTPPLPGTYG